MTIITTIVMNLVRFNKMMTIITTAIMNLVRAHTRKGQPDQPYFTIFAGKFLSGL
jgi:hypothetical protein